MSIFRVRFFLIAVSTALFAVSCASGTSMMLSISSDLEVPSEMDSIQIKIDEDGREVFDETYTPGVGAEMTLLIDPGRDEEYSVTIRVRGVKDGIDVAAGETVASFQRNRTVNVEVRLSRSGLKSNDFTDGGFNDGGSDAGATDAGDGGFSCISDCGLLDLPRCDAQGRRIVCADQDGKGCYAWKPPEACGNNSTCVEGECRCAANYLDCNEIKSDGCESAVMVDRENCGTCGKDCDPFEMNVSAGFCYTGLCDYSTCSRGYLDKDGDRSNGCEKWDYFPKLYGGVESSGMSMSIGNGGGIFISATTRKWGAGDSDLLLLSLFPDGDIEWQKSIGSVGFEIQSDVTRLADGAYGVLGITNSLGSTTSGNNLLALKITSAGTVKWQRVIGGTNGEYSGKITGAPDGGYYIAAVTDSLANSGELLIVRLGSEGDVLWQKSYEGLKMEPPSGIFTAHSGDLMVVSGKYSEENEINGLILKIDGEGEVKAAKEFLNGNGGSFKPVAILDADNGGYMLAGIFMSPEKLQDILVARLNENFDVECQNGIGGERADVVISARRAGGGMVISGYTESAGAGKRDMLIAMIMPDCSVNWQKTYGGTENDEAMALVENEDDNFLVGGLTESFGSEPGAADIILMAVDENGLIQGSCPSGFGVYSNLGVSGSTIYSSQLLLSDSDVSLQVIPVVAGEKTSGVSTANVCTAPK